LGDLYVRTDRLEEALAAYKQALPIYRAVQDRLGEANTHKALGDLYVRTARLEEALAAYKQALPIYRAVQDRLGEANTLQALARFSSLKGEAEEAERWFGEALGIYGSLGDRYSIAATLTYRGQHRLTLRDARAGADWGTALVLALGTEPFLARQVIAITLGGARQSCGSGEGDQVLSVAVPALLKAAEDATASAELAEDETDVLAVILDVFRLLGGIAAVQHMEHGSERSQTTKAIVEKAEQLDTASGGAFQLVELARQRLNVV
jgi:tetratricopeptide (TPR) repeat protein